MKSVVTRIIAFLIVLAMVVTPVSSMTVGSVSANGGLPERGDLVPTGHTPVDKYVEETAASLVDKNEISRYIVLFEGASLAIAREGTSINSQDDQAYLNQLAANRQAVLARAGNLLGRSIEVRYVYDVVLNGVSVELTALEAAKLSEMSGIRKVLKDQTYQLDTDAGPAWIGAGDIWAGSAVPDSLGTKGEGVLVGIIDSGINFDHPSFSATPDDGYVYTWTGDYLGVCATTGGDPAYASACNDKLVGAYAYTHDAPSETVTPEDSDGHGSHTASTVAGNTVALDYYGTPVTISGVAPHAQIIAYDVCYPTSSGGQCAGEDSVAAIQQAILNGVDVINYSISGGANPYQDPVELAFLEATVAGITVSTSAGNSGPTAGTVAHRSPWLLSTAASTHNRKFTSVVDFSNVLYQGITTLAGEIPFTTAVVNKAVKYAGENAGNDLGCAAFPAGFFSDSIALIKRGTCNFSVKINNAAAAGALGVLIFTDNRAPGAMSISGTSIPAVMLNIPGTTGDAIAAWVASASDDTVSISAYGKVISDSYADIMADFSSRGPNDTFDVLKPDITAPGVAILAAVADGTIAPSGDYEISLLQGTSMSSPHDAGSAALLKSLHPTWSPTRIKSALMLTATSNLLKEDGTTEVDPFDVGAGRIQLELAGLTGLVMDETIANFEAADPDLGGNVRTLNIPSLYNSVCVGECSWTRTFTSVADLPATYTVSAPAWITVNPSSFSIAPGDKQTVTITADVSGMTTDEWQFGTIEFNTIDHFAGGSSTELLSEGFESATFPPAGWSVYDVDGVAPVWDRTTSYKHNGAASVRHNYGASGTIQDGWVVTPPLVLTGGEYLSFWEQTLYFPFYVYHGLMISDGSPDPADGDYVELSEIDNVSTSWTKRSFSLSAYAGKTVYLAFRYQGEDADAWMIDDVLLYRVPAGKPISDVAMPLAVLPTASNLPELVKFETHRDTDSGAIEDLLAVEITELNVDKYGWVKGVKNEIQLAQDPSNGDPYDNLSQVWYTVLPMDAGAARVVAEITSTTALDLDLYWGFDVNGDGLPQENEEYGNSATATAFEYLTDWGFPAGFYDIWVMVQNWQGSGAALDDITLTIGVVPIDEVDPPNLTILGPSSNGAGIPFSLDVLWHDIDTEPGDRLYGLMEIAADAEFAVSIGVTQLDVIRGADEVIKTADVDVASPGDTVTYTIEITNYSDDELVYTINDVLPDGVTYVPGSVTGGATYDAGTNAILWSGSIDSSTRDYVAVTSAEDPNCTLGILTDGNPNDAYLDFYTTSYNFKTISSISGDSFWYGAFATYSPFNFYGNNQTGMDFTADGLTGWPDTISANNTNIPDPTQPNNIMALFWDDLVVQYNLANNYGVTLVGNSSTFAVVEYDDVQLKSDPSKTMDMEVGFFLQPDDAVGAYEIVYAFDNITPGFFSSASGTIGVENSSGSTGTLVSYNDPALTIANGSAICFDWAEVPAPPVVITFQVTVDADITTTTVVNTALHSNDRPHVVMEGASHELSILLPLKYRYLPIIER